MGALASQITSLTIAYPTADSDADQRKHQSSASLAFVWRSVNSPHKWPVMWKIFPSDDVIMNWRRQQIQWEKLYGKHYTNHKNRVLCCSTRITLYFVPDFVSYGFKCVYFISIEPQARKRGNIQKNATSKSASTNCEHTYNNNDILNSHTICTQLCVHIISHVCNVEIDSW